MALIFYPKFNKNNMIEGFRIVPCSGGTGTWICQDPSLSFEWNSDPIHNLMELFRDPTSELSIFFFSSGPVLLPDCS